MYHGFTDIDSQNGIINFHGKHMNAGNFRRQISYLNKNYNIIRLDQLVEIYRKGEKLPERAVVITFDDGYKSNYALAFPVLKELDAFATIFITTNFIEYEEFLWPDRVEYALDKTPVTMFDLVVNNEITHFDIPDTESRIACYQKINALLKNVTRESRGKVINELERKLGCKLAMNGDVHNIYRPLAWGEVMEMTGSGLVSIGSHTISHGIVTKFSTEKMREELSLPKQVIEKHTGVPCTLFAYPNGAPGDFSGQSRKVLIDLGYSCGLTTVKGKNDRHADVYELRRLAVKNNVTSGEFAMAVSGATECLLRAKASIFNK